MQTRSKRGMNITPIKIETDYQKALKRLEVVFDVAIGTPESDEADLKEPLFHSCE